MLVSVGSFAIINLMVKMLPNIPATEVILFRSVITLAISFSLLHRKSIPPLGQNKRWLLIRGLAGTTALTGFFFTLQKMPLSAAVTIQYLSPFFSAFMAAILLKEQTKTLQWLFFAISFTGIVLVKGSSTLIQPHLLIIGVASSFFAGLAYTAIRKLKDENPLVVVLYFPLVATPVMLVFSVFNWVTPNSIELLILLTIGGLTQIAQVYMTKSYQCSEISTVIPLKYVGVLFALTWDIMLFDFIPNQQLLLGIVLVIGGVLLNLQYKAQQKRRARKAG